MKNNKFNQRSDNSYVRKSNIREEKVKIIDKNKIVFSLKDFDSTQPKKNLQDFSSWEKDKNLSKFCEIIRELSKLTIEEAKKDEIITEYGAFPNDTDFTYPKHIDKDIRWAVIKKIEQKIRVVGYIVDNVFYIVFFDKDHQFWKVEKKHT